ncbi:MULTISPECIES: hypothetical protein [unclassified Amycolatopsis]|uniref:hypothetical protein n=1 Tax=unclassified Amycolatopsis TaxID=2618356 RepID=UPI00287692CE|nr:MULTISPECIES: hypothetical protein [unclassified Amycolatopsis]MDS0139536.1 hypothetical protein [Amycolatopsis sp. 505]MDS0147115.1 hypothetical protein [Amycolatopsis sp. CM201R]
MFRGVLATAAVALVLTAVPASADQPGGPIDLGTLPGGLTSDGRFVSNAGTVFGTAYDKTFNQRGARWDAAGRITELPPLPGYAAVDPVALGEDGVAVGNSMAANGWLGRATLWGASGVPVDLPPVPGFPGYANSSVAAINVHGVAVGYSYGAPGPDTAVKWDTTRGTVTALGFGRPSAINGAGAVIGGAKYWDPAGNVVPLEGGGTATDLDDAGTAVGSSGFHAAKWDAAGHLTVLDTTWKFSSAAEIGADGTIYGEVVGEDGKSRPARWDPAGRLTVFPAAGDARTWFTTANDSGSALVETSPGGFVVWGPGGRVTPLPLPAEGAYCRAADLNDRGAVTGECSVPEQNSHAVRWDLPVIGNR